MIDCSVAVPTVLVLFIKPRNITTIFRTVDVTVISVAWRFLRYALGLIGFALVVVVLLVISLSPPNLPSTNLGTLEARTYYMTLEELSETPPGQATDVVLSPQETSYLLEQYHPETSRYGFEMTDVHLEAEGSLGRIRTAFRTPGGFYVLLTYVGTIEVKNGEWILYPDSVSLGRLPVSWLIPSQWVVDGRTVYADGAVEINAARLNGQGLRARLINHGLQLDLSMEMLNQL